MEFIKHDGILLNLSGYAALLRSEAGHENQMAGPPTKINSARTNAVCSHSIAATPRNDARTPSAIPSPRTQEPTASANVTQPRAIATNSTLSRAVVAGSGGSGGRFPARNLSFSP